ncbi:MAG: hypothetical protein LBU77_00700 [Clostridiales bacterium]|jgi:hypothetical protein|nr:hypothetical protein [Clostridiales bacterium]
MALTNINFMMNLVNSYVSGDMPRYLFELDFQSELLSRYKKMVREDREYAELFYDWLSDDGVDAGADLSDAAFKRLIKKQYKEVKSIVAEGFW